MTEKKDCTNYLGMIIAIAKPILIEQFGGIEKEMPPFYPGYEFIVLKLMSRH